MTDRKTTKIHETQEKWIIEGHASNWRRNDPEEYEKAMPTLRARVAIDLAGRFGVVAAVPDGEDSSGRSKLSLMTPRDVVARSLEISDILVSSFEEMGWMDQMPSPHDRFGDAIVGDDE